MVYSEEELLAELRRVAEEVGRTPRTRDVQQHGQYSHTLYYDRFDSWEAALDAAGLEIDDHRYSKEELIDELQRLADGDEPPTMADLNEHGEYSPSPYVDRFGSWNDALEAAGFEPRHSTTAISENELLEDLRRAAEECEPPTSKAIREQLDHSKSTYRNKFGSWTDALEEAGVSLIGGGRRLSQEELLDEIQRLTDELGHPPTLDDLRKHGKYSPPTYYRRFESWSDALAAAGCSTGDEEVRIADETLIQDLHRLADDLDRPPTLQELRECGEYGATTYIKRFGSWRAALETAGYEPREPESEIPKADLIAELRAVAEELDEQPSAAQMNEHGEYWVSTYRRRFGSWQAALEAAGFENVPTAGPIPDEELIAELRRLADDCDGAPTMAEMDDEGAFSSSTYVRRFGSWTAALEEAGVA